jgi:hypothetical protein
MWRFLDLVWTGVSKERIASIFRGEKSASEEPAWAGGSLARGFFYPEYGGDKFLGNVGSHTIYEAPHPRRRHSSFLTIFLLKKERRLKRLTNNRVTESNIRSYYIYKCIFKHTKRLPLLLVMPLVSDIPRTPIKSLVTAPLIILQTVSRHGHPPIPYTRFIEILSSQIFQGYRSDFPHQNVTGLWTDEAQYFL